MMSRIIDLRNKEKLLVDKLKQFNRGVIQKSALISWFIQVLGICQKNMYSMQVIFTIGYRLALDILYVALISPIFSYSGFTLDISPLNYLASLVTIVCFSPFIGKLLNDDRPSSIIVTCINYIYFIPLTSYIGCKGTDIWFFAIAIGYWGWLLILQSIIPSIRLRPLRKKHTKHIFSALTLVAIAFVLFISGKYTGFRINLNFINVYDIRLTARNYEILPIFTYILNMMPVVLSILILYWLKRKKYLIIGILIITYLLYYSISAQKSVFLLLFMVLFGYFLYHKWMLRGLPGLLIPVTALTFLENLVFNTQYLVSLFFRRMMYVPANLSEIYYQFFQDNPLNLFRDGIMGKISFENIYSMGIPRIIGEWFFNPQNNANNGLLGDMFANLPIPIGIIVMPIILVICIRILDMGTARLESKFYIALCIYFANSFINTYWSTVLLNSGFLLACLLLYLFPKEGKNQDERV